MVCGYHELQGDTMSCRFEGVWTQGDLFEWRIWIQALPKKPSIFKQVIDLTEVHSSTLTPNQWSDFADTGIFPHEVRRAIVANDGSRGYGWARMFQSHMEVHLGDLVQLFTNEEDAMEWLNRPAAVKDIPSH
jgi:hypothetical protein